MERVVGRWKRRHRRRPGRQSRHYRSGRFGLLSTSAFLRQAKLCPGWRKNQNARMFHGSRDSAPGAMLPANCATKAANAVPDPCSHLRFVNVRVTASKGRIAKTPRRGWGSAGASCQAATTRGFSAPAALRAVAHALPIAFPFLAPGEWTRAACADLVRQVRLGSAARRLVCRTVRHRSNSSWFLRDAPSGLALRVCPTIGIPLFRLPCLSWIASAVARKPEARRAPYMRSLAAAVVAARSTTRAG